MRNLLNLLFCLLTVSSFCLAENINPKNRQQNLFSSLSLSNQSDFPNVFHPIGNLFKKLFRKKVIIEEHNADVFALYINRTDMMANCSTTNTSCSKNQIVDLEAIVKDTDNDVLTYLYKVSAGKIIGEGAKVVWDLSGVPPGTYTVTAGVDDGCGVCGQTRTQAVKIIECPNCN